MDLTSSVVRYIMRNFRQPPFAGAYCKGAGRQQHHLSHVLRAAAHQPEYVNALVAGCARDLLAATELSMLEVSMESGSTACGRSTVFQERFRQTPSQYRKVATGALWAHRTGSGAKAHNALCAW